MTGEPEDGRIEEKHLDWAWAITRPARSIEWGGTFGGPPKDDADEDDTDEDDTDDTRDDDSRDETATTIASVANPGGCPPSA